MTGRSWFGDQQHVEVDELVTLARGEPCDPRPSRHPVTVVDDAEVGDGARGVDPRPEADVGGQDVVRRPQQPARVGEALAAVELEVVVELTEEPMGAIGVEARFEAAEDVEGGERLGGRPRRVVG